MQCAIPTVNPLVGTIDKYLDWLKHSAIPVWATKGLRCDGGSVERLTDKGQPDLNANQRMRVQARQMFVFAASQHNGWLENGLDIIAGLDRFVNQYAVVDNSSIYAHMLDCDNRVISANQDIYDVAFFLLAYGWRYHVFNDLNALSQASKLINQINIDLKGESGGWMEGDYYTRFRRQNPHMHLFEAFLCLYHVTNDGKWLAKAGEIFCLFETRFYDSKRGVLLEYFNNDWTPADDGHGDIVEPGHMMEWVWLLRQYQKVTQTPVDRYCNTLYHNAIAMGLDSASGLLYDEVSVSGAVVKATKRCWPMTEWIKASLAQTEFLSAGKSVQHNYQQDALSALRGLMSFYINDNSDAPYIDKLDEQNRVMDSGAPASTMYHLVMAALEAQRYVKCSRNFFDR